MVPLGTVFSYFLVMPIAEEDLKQYLEDPIAALPQAICAVLPKVGILLVPYLEKTNGKNGDVICFDKPADPKQIFWSRSLRREVATLVFAVKDEEMADYHYSFYNGIAALVAGSPEDVRAKEQFYGLIREELAAEVHGEVDERSWRLKQSLLRRQSNTRKETKLFHDYARQALEDTLTLFLHGICCDIDVETGRVKTGAARNDEMRHGIQRPSYQRDRYERYLGWYDKYIKGKTAPAPSGGAVSTAKDQ
jgi:hypothetical protein